MSVTESTPYGRAAAPQRFVIEVTIGEGTRTPRDIMATVERALNIYGFERDGILTPFAQQPGYPDGDVFTADGVLVGHWKVEGGV